MKRGWRPSLLLLTATSAIASTVAHGVGVANPGVPVPVTRLGVAINKDAASRDLATAGRNRALDLREQAARATEARIKADIAARTAAAAAAAAVTPKGGAPAEGGEQFDSLARVYQAMKPGPAAAVFEKLEMDVQLQVAKRMRDRSLAMILANMSTAAATNLSMALARKSVAAVTKPVGPVPAAKLPS